MLSSREIKFVEAGQGRAPLLHSLRPALWPSVDRVEGR